MNLLPMPPFNEDKPVYYCEWCDETFTTKNPTEPCCTISERKLGLDGGRGIYIPQNFVELFDPDEWHISVENSEILLAGPGEFYWEAWEEVLDSAFFIDKHGNKWSLYQDSDLFFERHE